MGDNNNTRKQIIGFSFDMIIQWINIWEAFNGTHMLLEIIVHRNGYLYYIVDAILTRGSVNHSAHPMSHLSII